MMLPFARIDRLVLQYPIGTLLWHDGVLTLALFFPQATQMAEMDGFEDINVDDYLIPVLYDEAQLLEAVMDAA